jgi:CRP/FNR family nitrogen fixation transcriptional regulator
VSAPGWTHERVLNGRPIPQALEALATVTRYEKDQEIYPQESPVGCWYRVVSGAARRFALRADGKRQIIDLLLSGDMFGFGIGGKHVFNAEAITPNAVIARYPTSRIDSLVASHPHAARELRDTIVEAISRLNTLILILGRTTAEEKVGAFLLYMQERMGDRKADQLALPITRYDIADYLSLSVETVSRALTALKQRGVIALAGPRQIGIVDRDALADGPAASEPFAPPLPMPVQMTTPMPIPTPKREPSRSGPTPQTCSVQVRVPAYAFADVLNEMRGWFDHQRCDPSRFSCIRDGSGAVVVRVEFIDSNRSMAKAFEEQFAANTPLSVTA